MSIYKLFNIPTGDDNVYSRNVHMYLSFSYIQINNLLYLFNLGTMNIEIQQSNIH